MDASPAFALSDLTKSFGNVVALDGLTVTVPRGSVGLVGANGAGKTTMFRLLLGLDQAHEGSRRGPRVWTCRPTRSRRGAGSDSCPSTTACRLIRPQRTWSRRSVR